MVQLLSIFWLHNFHLLICHDPSSHNAMSQHHIAVFTKQDTRELQCNSPYSGISLYECGRIITGWHRRYRLERAWCWWEMDLSGLSAGSSPSNSPLIEHLNWCYIKSTHLFHQSLVMSFKFKWWGLLVKGACITLLIHLHILLSWRSGQELCSAGSTNTMKLKGEFEGQYNPCGLGSSVAVATEQLALILLMWLIGTKSQNSYLIGFS